MNIFRRLTSKAKNAVKRRNKFYDPYESAQSYDNPYLTPIGAGLVYKTLEYLLFSVWPLVNEYDAYIPETIENILIGMDSKFGDDEDPLIGACGYMFEAYRLIRVTLNSDTDAYAMPILTSDEDTIVTESLSYTARAFIAATLDGEPDDAMRIADTAAQGDFDGYLQLLVTIMTLVVREWFGQAFPEFNPDTADALMGDSGNDDE